MADRNGSSDWSDLDLLTRGEAAERLINEIRRVERELADLARVGESQGNEEGLRTRLAALRERLAQ